MMNLNCIVIRCPTSILDRHDFIDGGSAAPDCDGHGTIVASIAMGHTVGVAKEASLVALRVLDCQGAGSVSNVVAGVGCIGCMAASTAGNLAPISLKSADGSTGRACTQPLLPQCFSCSTCEARALGACIAALDWVTHNGTKPSVATLSLGIPVGAWSQTLEDATKRVLAAGILVVVAAGCSLVFAACSRPRPC